MAECYIERRFEVKRKPAVIFGHKRFCRDSMRFRIRSARKMVEKGVITQEDLAHARRRLIDHKRDQAARLRGKYVGSRLKDLTRRKVLGHKPGWYVRDYCCIYILDVAKERLPWVHYIPEPEVQESYREVLPDLP